MVFMREPPFRHAEPLRGHALGEEDVVRIRHWFEVEHKAQVSGRNVLDALQIVSRQQRFHPVADYLASLTWDGAPRVDTWLKDFCSVKPTSLDHQRLIRAPYRQHDGDVFRRDLEKAGCPKSFKGEPLTPYSLRHMFSTLLTESHAHDAAHDRMMGHRPKDTKTLNYSAKLLPFLATEIERIPFDLPPDAPSFGASSAVAPPAPSPDEDARGDAPAA